MTTRTLTVILWLAAASAMPLLAPRGVAAPEREPLERALSQVEGWSWQRSDATARQDLIKSGLMPLCDGSFLAEFTSEGMSFEVQVFYCSSRRPKNRLIYYLDTIQCLHGHYSEVQSERFELAGYHVRRLRLRGRHGSSTLLYWLQSPGVTSTSSLGHGMWLCARDVTGRPSEGLFVKVAYYGAPDAEKDRLLGELAESLHSDLADWFAGID